MRNFIHWPCKLRYLLWNIRTYCVTFCTNVEIMWKTRSFHWFNLISVHLRNLLQISKCRKLRNFWRNFCLKTVVTYSFWQISRLCYCAYCLKFNCYSLACIAYLRNIHLHILQNARVAVLPLESTWNAAHHRKGNVEENPKDTLEQRMSVSNFANNSLSAFTGSLKQSLLYHNMLHH